MPPIRISTPATSAVADQNVQTEAKSDGEGRRLLQEQYGGGGFMYEIEEVVSLKVESSFYEPGQDEIRIASYALTSMDSTKLDINVEFLMPKKISQSANELDGLNVEFVDTLMFKALSDGS